LIYIAANYRESDMKTIPGRLLFVVKVFGQALFLYGLLGWAYGVLIQLTYPSLLPEQISHLTPWLRLDTFTILSFIGSGIGFLLWRLARDLGESTS
jgi:hypothetical protein